MRVKMCVVAQAKRGGIDVLLNENSNRLNPCLVSFQGNRRFVGEGALSLARVRCALESDLGLPQLTPPICLYTQRPVWRLVSLRALHVRRAMMPPAR
jgi:hypothetical protein